jgi:hypothetical protein
MDIKWGALGEVFIVSFGVTVVLVALFALAAALLAGPRTSEDEDDAQPGDGAAVAVPVGISSKAVAALCFAVCGATVLYGLYLIIAK